MLVIVASLAGDSDSASQVSRDGVAAGFGGEDVGPVSVERAAVQAASLVDREQPFDRALAALGAAAERELAVDDRGA
jgi:hypothetical protein